MLVTFASYELGASGPGVLFVGLKTAEFQGFPIVLECWCWDLESTFDAAVAWRAGGMRVAMTVHNVDISTR